MYFEFLNRTQTLHFGFFGEGECDFQRKVPIIEICSLLALSKNPEYYTAGKCASPLSEFFWIHSWNHSLFKERLQKCTLGALYFSGSDHWPPLTLYVPIVTNVNLLLTVSIHCQEMRLWELIKWSPKRKCLDLLSNFLNWFFRKCMETSLENLYVDTGA